MFIDFAFLKGVSKEEPKKEMYPEDDAWSPSYYQKWRVYKFCIRSLRMHATFMILELTNRQVQETSSRLNQTSDSHVRLRTVIGVKDPEVSIAGLWRTPLALRVLKKPPHVFFFRFR